MVLRVSKRLVAFMLGVMLGVEGHTAAAQSISLEVFEYGVYTAKTEIPATGANETMKSAGLTNICHVMTTTTVPNRDKLNFGFRYRVHGSAAGDPVDLRLVVRWPDHLKASTSPETYVENEHVKRRRVGETSYLGWTNWQTRPGIWTFRIFEVDRKLAEMAFTVVDKDEIKVKPDGDSVCFPISDRREAVTWHWT